MGSQKILGDAALYRKWIEEGGGEGTELRAYARDPALRRRWGYEMLDRGNWEAGVCWFVVADWEGEGKAEKVVGCPVLFVGEYFSFVSRLALAFIAGVRWGDGVLCYSIFFVSRFSTFSPYESMLATWSFRPSTFSTTN